MNEKQQKLWLWLAGVTGMALFFVDLSGLYYEHWAEQQGQLWLMLHQEQVNATLSQLQHASYVLAFLFMLFYGLAHWDGLKEGIRRWLYEAEESPEQS